jgi:hypothetical protein
MHGVDGYDVDRLQDIARLLVDYAAAFADLSRASEAIEEFAACDCDTLGDEVCSHGWEYLATILNVEDALKAMRGSK